MHGGQWLSRLGSRGARRTEDVPAAICCFVKGTAESDLKGVNHLAAREEAVGGVGWGVPAPWAAHVLPTRPLRISEIAPPPLAAALQEEGCLSLQPAPAAHREDLEAEHVHMEVSGCRDWAPRRTEAVPATICCFAKDTEENDLKGVNLLAGRRGGEGTQPRGPVFWRQHDL